MIKVYIVLNKRILLILFFLCLIYNQLKAQSIDSTKVVYLYFINTHPFNAEVYYNDTLVGLTPIRFTTSDRLDGNVLLKKKGYEDVKYDLQDYNFEKGVEINLKFILPTEEKLVLKNRNTNFVKKRSIEGIIASGIIALGSGVLAYTTKEKANDFYNHYVDNRSQSDLDKSRKYDIYSGISLGLMQVSIAGLIYFLFLQ